MASNLFERLGLGAGWIRELAVAAILLGLGFGVLPALIFLAGSATLGRYDGATTGGVYEAVYRGLQSGSLASWVVVLGPYALYLLFKALRLWWVSSARLA